MRLLGTAGLFKLKGILVTARMQKDVVKLSKSCCLIAYSTVAIWVGIKRGNGMRNGLRKRIPFAESTNGDKTQIPQTESANEDKTRIAFADSANGDKTRNCVKKDKKKIKT